MEVNLHPKVNYSFHYANFWEARIINQFSGAFAKLRKATMYFVMFVPPCGINQLPLDAFL